MAELTVYPEAGQGGGNVSMDNMLTYDDVIGVWTDGVNAAAATSESPTGTFLGLNENFFVGISLTIARFLMSFDTSAMGAGATVTAATLSIYLNSGDLDVWTKMVSVSPDDLADMDLDDYNNVGSTVYSTNSWPGTAQYGAWVLNAAGRSNIVVDGISGFALRSVQDVADSASDGSSGSTIKSADTAGTSNDPKLVITYTPPAPPSGFFNFLLGQ